MNARRQHTNGIHLHLLCAPLPVQGIPTLILLQLTVKSAIPGACPVPLQVQGIPMLIILDGDNGSVINRRGRDAVEGDEECAGFPWRPKTVSEVCFVTLICTLGSRRVGTKTPCVG